MAKEDWEKYKKPVEEDNEKSVEIKPLSEDDIQVLKTYSSAPYSTSIKSIEKDLKDLEARIKEKMGVEESDTGLANPNLWDVAADRKRMHDEQPLQVARCTKIIKSDEAEEADEVDE